MIERFGPLSKPGSVFNVVVCAILTTIGFMHNASSGSFSPLPLVGVALEVIFIAILV